MKVVLKRRLAVLLAVILMLTSAVPTFAANSRGATKNDIAGHWAEDDLLTMSSNGIMGGYPDGSMKPNRYVTIAETVKIINKAFRLDGSGDVYSIPYSDVKIHEWYSNDIALAVENGYLLAVAPGKQLKPNAPATREQIGAMLAQIMGLKLDSLDSVTKYSDYGKITGGYQYYFAATVKEGLFVGYPDNTVRPKSTVTRGIVAAVTNRAMTSSAGVELHPVFVGPNDILVETAGTIITNRIVDNIWISESVGEGNVTLDNVKVRGKLVIKGGGPNSVIIKGDSNVPLVYMEKESKDLRLKVEKPAWVGNVNINSGSRNYITGEIDSLIQNVTRSEIKVEKATIKTVEIVGESTDLYIDKSSTITMINVNRKAADAYMSLDGKVTSVVIAAPFVKTQVYGTVNNISIASSGKAAEVIAEKGSQITTVKTEADRVSVRGDGVVENAIINGNDCKIDTVPTKVEIDKDASGNTSNGKEIPGGSTGTTKPGGGIDGGSETGIIPGVTTPGAIVSSLTITTPPKKLVYYQGDKFDMTGVIVTTTYSNGSSKDVGMEELAANGLTANPKQGSTLTASAKTLTISNLVSKKNTSTPIVVNLPATVKELNIKELPEEVNYISGEKLSLKGLVVTVSYSDGETEDISFESKNQFTSMGMNVDLQDGSTLTANKSTESRSVAITYTSKSGVVTKAKQYMGITISQTPLVNQVVVSTTTIPSVRTLYVEGEALDLSNLEITLNKDYVPSDRYGSSETLKYDTQNKSFVYKETGLPYNTGNRTILAYIRDAGAKSVPGSAISHGEKLTIGPVKNSYQKIITIQYKETPAGGTPRTVSTEMYINVNPTSYVVGVTIPETDKRVKATYNEGETLALDNLELVLYKSELPNDAIIFDINLKSFVYKDKKDEFGNPIPYNTQTKRISTYMKDPNVSSTDPEKVSSINHGDIVPLGTVVNSYKKNIIIRHIETMADGTSRTFETLLEVVVQPVARVVQMEIAPGSSVKTSYKTGELLDYTNLSLILYKSLITGDQTQSGTISTERVVFKKADSATDSTLGYFVVADENGKALVPEQKYNLNTKWIKTYTKLPNGSEVENSSGNTLSFEGEQVINIRHVETLKDGKSVIAETPLTIRVVPSTGLESIVAGGDIKKSYYVGEALDLSGLIVQLKFYEEANSRDYTLDKLGEAKVTVTPTNGSTLLNEGSQTVTISHENGKSTTIAVDVLKPQIINGGTLNDSVSIPVKIPLARVIPGLLNGANYDVTASWKTEAGVTLAAGTPFAANEKYRAVITLTPKRGFTFKGMTGTFGVAGLDGNDVAAIIFPAKDVIPQGLTTIGAQNIYTLTTPVFPVTSATAPMTILNATPVSTSTEFYEKLADTSVAAIEIVKDMTISKDTVINKTVIVKEGVTLSYSVDATIAGGRSTNARTKSFKITRKFRITNKGALIIKAGGVLNQVGAGSYTIDNGGKIVAYGTISKSGKKWIGKDGTTLKTYGNASVEITNSVEGQVMTLNGTGDLLQSLTLDSNLVIGNSSNLNIKPGKSLRVNGKTAITNKGTIYMEDDSSIYGSGKYVGESPIGNYFAGFNGCDNDAVKYGTKKTSLNYYRNESDVRLSLTIPYKTKTIYFSGVSINAGDLRPASYQLTGTDGLRSATFVVGKPSVKTGLSIVSLGTKGLAIPSTLTPGRYTLNGIMGGANVILEINIV
ncbi:MAG: S-layer homology domain-containing protein [Proteocatella sp.]